MRQHNEYADGTMPGVCEYCGYRIRPDVEDVAVVGTWDFAHETCEADE